MSAPKKKPTSKGASRQAPALPPLPAEAVEHFVRGIVSRGEAATCNAEGELPPGATHEIVEESDGGPPKLKRRRFSMF